jgi:hypothetical protein
VLGRAPPQMVQRLLPLPVVILRLKTKQYECN